MDREAFRKRFKAYKEGKPVSEIYDAGLPKYAGGKRGYIGGSTKHARETVWNTDQTLSNAVDSIANAYLLKDGLLLHRLNEEGFTDKAIRLYNNARNQSLYTGENLLNNKTDFSGVGDFGLDDAGTMILNNQMLLKGEKWWDEEGENEQGRITHGAVGDTVRDTIGLQASALKYFSDQVKKDYPNLSDYDNARYTQAYYQRGVGGGRKWAKAGAKGYNFSTKPLAMRPVENPYLIQTTIQSTAAPKFGSYKNGKLPGFRGGKTVIGSNVDMKDDGTFTDDYTRVFDDLVVTTKGPRVKTGQLYKYQQPWNDLEFMNAATMGLNPLLSPIHTGRALYNIVTDSGYHDIGKDIFMPNAGLFTNNFYNNHPIISSIGNIAGDVTSGIVINKTINPLLQLIDRGGTPMSRILYQGDDTMTRLIGTGDTGYKDLLTSVIIRGNKKPTRSGTTGQLHKIADKIRNLVSEDDIRDYLSNNFRTEEQYNRIRDAVRSLDDVKSQKTGGILLAKKKHWDYPETYDEYIKMTTSPEALHKQNNLMFSRLWSNKNKNPWVENWLPKENVAVDKYDWPNLPTFALKNEKLSNDLFVGDFAVQIKNAHKHAQEAFDFGHFHEHPTTKYPMGYLHPDVSVYRRSDGILTGTKYMKKVPKWKLKYDAYKYKTNPNYTLDVSKNYTPIFPSGIPNILIPYFVGLSRVLDKNITE